MVVDLIAACLLLHLIAPLPVHMPRAGQDSSAVLSAARPPSLDEATRPQLSGALSRLKADEKIKVELLSLDRFEGRFIKISDSTLFVGVEQKLETQPLIIQQTLRADSIQSVWVGQDLKGWGAVIGGVVGLALGAAWASPDAESGLAVGTGAPGAVMGLVAGALTGLVIGSAVTLWERIYP